MWGWGGGGGWSRQRGGSLHTCGHLDVKCHRKRLEEKHCRVNGTLGLFSIGRVQGVGFRVHARMR